MKAYTRGRFRAIKAPKVGYYIQVYIRQGDSWLNFDHCDYLGNARRKVRNLHSADCSSLEVAEFIGQDHRRKRASRKPLDLQPCKDV